MASHTPSTLQNDAEQNTMFHGSDIHYYELHAEGKKYQVLVNAITGDSIYYQEMKNEDLEEEMVDPDLEHLNGADDFDGDMVADDSWRDFDVEAEIPQRDDEDQIRDRDREWVGNPWEDEERWEEQPDREEESQWENEGRWWYERFRAEHTRRENQRLREMIEEKQEEYALIWVYPEEWYLWKRSHRRHGCRYIFFRLLFYD